LAKKYIFSFQILLNTALRIESTNNKIIRQKISHNIKLMTNKIAKEEEILKNYNLKNLE